MSRLFRVALLFLVTTACTPSVSSACWFLPLPWHCGWSWSPFDPCGVYSSNCGNGHCGVRRPRLLRGPVWANRQNRIANRRANIFTRRTNRACNRCARLQQRQCTCNPMVESAAMCGVGVGTMAAGPIPMTTQVPITTYRNVTVDMGSYQRVWVPRIVTQRVPQTSYQTQTLWTNPQQPCCTDSGHGTFVSPSIGGLGAPVQMPLGSPYGGVPIDSTVPISPSIQGSSIISPPIQPTPDSGYDGVPYPPAPAAAVVRPTRSASALGLSTGIYSDGLRSYPRSYTSRSTAPALPGLSTRTEVIADRAIEDDSFDDWVNVEPSGQTRTATNPVYEPQRYEERTQPGTVPRPERSRSGMFSPVRPGTGITRARFVGK